MKDYKYRNASEFLDEFRGREFGGIRPTVPELFHITRLRFPNNRVFKSFNPEREYTYSEAEEIIINIASYLRDEGLEKGDKYAVTGSNTPDWVFAYFAVLYAGGIIVPLDNTLHNDEMEHFLEFGGVKGIFSDSERLSSLSDKYVKHNLSSVTSLKGSGEIKLSSKCDDIASVNFTSGTTGTPKGVMLTHDNLVSDCLLTQSNILITEKDVIYAVLPLHHAYTMMAVVYMAISTGGSIVFGEKLAMSRILTEIREGGVTMFMAVPMLYNKMVSALMTGVRNKSSVLYLLVRFMMFISGILKRAFGINVGKKWFSFLLKKLSLENIRVCISGGSPLPVATFRMYQQLGIDFVQGYGLTEASPITHLNPIEAFRLESVGKLFPEEEVRIDNPDDEGNGEILIKGPMVMKGYYNNPEATNEVLDNGWLKTGDVGHQDSEGYLYITGRSKSVIVTEGGKNVFPEEIEDKFQLFDEIDQICVIGYTMDRARLSEGVRAVILPSESLVKEKGSDTMARIEEIVDSVNRGLVECKKITSIVIADHRLPVTSTSKIIRRKVKEEYGDK